MLRKFAFALAAASLALSLTACSKPAGSEMPTVASPQFGTIPEINFPAAPPPEAPVMKILDDGDGKGEEVKDGDLVVVDYYGKVWGGAVMPDSTITDTAGPRAISLAHPPIEGWKELRGVKVGQRVLMILPPSQAYGEMGSSSIGVKKDDTLAYVVDVRLAVSPDAASKFQVTPTNNPLPNGISINPDGQGAYTLNTAAAGAYPSAQDTAVYATGDGPAVKAGQGVIVKRVSTDWNGQTTAADWNASEMISVSADSMGLADLPLGSLVLVITPATPTADPQATLLQLVAAYDSSR
ncbi:FKBP-type peptidyl-prolyl cis-trans isomerase [Mobiluncus curtisii]|nr:FKBP-type peptidyl-prolyl cis-trans isomerase [Mobiluncus curtisii]EFL94710.1 peptidyl-prolyl cis-trans isomerase, FKBP-type [Mobiluncus curtisii subsp. curtisii ATCC 35241]NMW86979.1 FKBP-type peptidyl-prolyl cis-trans isomerase [Mobiluncus curtisii]NMW89394.1 FKBP-type peptidyl-prolyl cis-trans isomerase [Mobiluncus curtisii]QQT13354.1 FKBP-type peptidyl-prolyl cis-trans isomerase [Mobiluncus curtisii]QQU08237.1 FKBP-type peptidyl-prolyl cis-trans isomerase [Mobiluncus curtisii]